MEWSLYNEDLKIAGQIDSLWLDLDKIDNDKRHELILVDWKRTSKFLTSDRTTLQQQACSKLGTLCCSHLYDTAWSHYFVQQTLYAYLLRA